MGVATDLRFQPIKFIFQHCEISYVCRSKEITDKYSGFDLMKKSTKKNLTKKEGHH